MTRNKSTDALKQIGGGSGGRQFSLGSAGPGVGTDGQFYVTSGGAAQWQTISYATPTDITTALTPYVTQASLTTQLEPLVSGIEHGVSVNGVAQAPNNAEPEGTLYIVGTAPTGAFVGHANEVAFLESGVWKFAAPLANEAHLNEATNQILHWNGTAWVNVGSVSHVGQTASVVMHKIHVGDTSNALFLEKPFTTKPGYLYVMDFGCGFTGSHNYTSNRLRCYINGGMVLEGKDSIDNAYQCSQNVKWLVEGTGNTVTFGFRLNWDGGVSYKYVTAMVTEIRLAA